MAALTAALLALLASLTLSACGGAERLDDLPPASQTHLVAGVAHHLVVRAEADATVVRAVGADGAVLATTRLAPESLATVDGNAAVVIERLGGRVRARRHGDAVARWTWPARGRAVDSHLRDEDVLALDDAGRLCLLAAADGRELDCVRLPAAAGLSATGVRLVGGGSIAGKPWAWLRGESALVAVALTGRCSSSPCAARIDGEAWAVGLGRDQPAPQVLGDAIWLQPAPGVIELRDGRTGALRRAEVAPRFGALWPVGDALIVLGHRDDGAALVAALDATTGALRWQRGLRAGPLPSRVEAGAGVVRLLHDAGPAGPSGSAPGASDGELVLRASDGALLGELPPALAAVANEEAWLGLLRDGRLASTALAARDRAQALLLPPQPPWLRDGTELHYVVHWPGEPPRRVTMRLLQVSPRGAKVQFPGPAGLAALQIWDLDRLESGRTLCLLPRASEPDAAACPQVLLGRQTARALRGGATLAIGWPTAAALPTRLEGEGLHAIGLREADAEAPRRVLLPSLRLRPLTGGGLLEVGAWAGAPLLLHLERGALQITFVGAATAAPGVAGGR